MSPYLTGVDIQVDIVMSPERMFEHFTSLLYRERNHKYTFVKSGLSSSIGIRNLETIILRHQSNKISGPANNHVS